MVNYIVTVFTGNFAASTTLNNVFIKLVGTDGESKRKWLIGLKGASAFIRGTVSLEYPSLCLNIYHFSYWTINSTEKSLMTSGSSVSWLLNILCLLVISPGVFFYCILPYIPWKTSSHRARQTGSSTYPRRLLVPFQGRGSIPWWTHLQIPHLPVDQWQRGTSLQRRNRFVWTCWYYTKASL